MARTGHCGKRGHICDTMKLTTLMFAIPLIPCRAVAGISKFLVTQRPLENTWCGSTKWIDYRWCSKLLTFYSQYSAFSWKGYCNGLVGFYMELVCFWVLHHSNAGTSEKSRRMSPWASYANFHGVDATMKLGCGVNVVASQNTTATVLLRGSRYPTGNLEL